MKIMYGYYFLVINYERGLDADMEAMVADSAEYKDAFLL
jgi:hypothetical protein